MLGNISCSLIKTEEIKDKKVSNFVVLNVKDATNQLELWDIEIEEETEMLLKEHKKMLNFYISAAQHLEKKLPLDSQKLNYIHSQDN